MSRPRPEQRRNALLYCVTALLITLLGTGRAVALPDDQEQPIRITADQALRNEKKGVTVYSGNVHLNQGSLRIDADKLTIYHMSEDLDRVIAEGSPATLQQQPETEGGPVNARARIITYYRSEDRVHLEREAHIERDGSIVTGDSIDYYIAEELVKADSDQEQEGSRVQVVIPPQVMEQDRDTSGATDSE